MYLAMTAPVALFCASYFVGYELLIDIRRKHGQRNPLIYDEMLAFSVLNTVAASSLLGTKFFMAGIITGILQAFAISVIWTSGIHWYSTISAWNVFYEDGVSEEEKDKFEYMDDVEHLGWIMKSKRFYGYSYDRNNETFS